MADNNGNGSLLTDASDSSLSLGAGQLPSLALPGAQLPKLGYQLPANEPTVRRAKLYVPPAPKLSLASGQTGLGQSGLSIAPKAEAVPANTTMGPGLSGLATNFGHDINGKTDQYMLSKLGESSRIGAFGADVTDPNTVGVSLPIKTINQYIGNYQKDPQIRNDIANGRYQVQVTTSDGNSGVFRIVDVGPGPNEPGKIDITGSAMKQLGMTGNADVNFQIVDTQSNQVASANRQQSSTLLPQGSALLPQVTGAFSLLQGALNLVTGQ